MGGVRPPKNWVEIKNHNFHYRHHYHHRLVMANIVVIHITWSQVLDPVHGGVPPMKIPMAMGGDPPMKIHMALGGEPPPRKKVSIFLCKLASIRHLKGVLILKYT